MLVRPNRRFQPGQLSTEGTYPLAPMASPSTAPTFTQLEAGRSLEQDPFFSSCSISSSDRKVNLARTPYPSEKEGFNLVSLMSNDFVLHIISLVLVAIIITLALQIMNLSGRVKFLESMNISRITSSSDR